MLGVATIQLGAIVAQAGPAHAATGDLVGSVTFSQNCGSGLGTGITYDGTNLWYSCYSSNPDLLRANPTTGAVTASYNIASGLGSLAYDATRNAIWAGAGGSYGTVRLIQLDAGKNVTSSAVAFNAGNDVTSLTDGVAYDGVDDTLYLSPDGSTVIHHYKTDGTKIGDINWAGSGCYNSGVAIGGSLLFEGSDGCNHVWVVDKATPAVVVFDFSTSTAGDPNFRDEGLTCDTNTFAPKQVMWSKEAFSPMRAHAFEVPAGTCGVGGKPAPATKLSESASPASGDAPLNVTFTYNEQNTGTDPISNVAVSGDICGPASLQSGDANSNNILDPGETWVLTCSHTFTSAGTFTDNATGTGTDTVTKTDAPREAASASVTVNRVGTTVTYTGPTTSDFNDAVTVSATLKDTNGNPVSGATITFTLNGAETCTGTTDASGNASCSITPKEPAGGYTLTADFAGDGGHVPSSTSTAFNVTLEETTISYTGPTLVANGGPATLSGVLKEDGSTAISGRTVTLTLGSGLGSQSCTGTTDGAGAASCTIAAVNQPLGPGSATAAFSGDGFYKPATDTKPTLVFAFSTGGSFVVGDKTANGPVTFWGAQWAKVNSLSSGPAPAAFKGFENSPAKPACGVAWKTDPGNSAGPPASIPSYMAVIVSSAVSQSGSTISGNDVHVVIVKTNPGYAADPGHAGTGTVVAQLC